jgi:tetraacyldisaccharide 4'-kinase
MQFLRLLLLPFSWIYGLIVVIRNWCYDVGIFKSYRAEVPVISVGNLEVGGAGKSPMTEYLIRLFKGNHKLATLSRGYGRETKGYFETKNLKVSPTGGDLEGAATTIGDEPSQFAHKFPDITVAVCENRAPGIKKLQTDHDLIILDDAYQHRAVKPGFSILLFDYNKIGQPRLLLPAGNYREPFSGRKRADIIVISKCPEQLSDDERQKAIKRLKPYLNQQVFFTFIAYQPLKTLAGDATYTVIDKATTVFLLTGIANANPLVQHIQKSTQHIIHHNYPDHHRFTLKNITKLAAEFNSCASKNKVIITTEKDAQRLLKHDLLQAVTQLPVLILPIGISFLNNAQQQFNNLVTNYVRQHTEHRPVH